MGQGPEPRGARSQRAQTLRLPYAPLRRSNACSMTSNSIARGYFVEVEHPELGRKFRYPGAPYLFSGTPWRVYRRPPLLGEQTSEILRGELGLSNRGAGGAARGRSVLRWRCRSGRYSRARFHLGGGGPRRHAHAGRSGRRGDQGRTPGPGLYDRHPARGPDGRSQPQQALDRDQHGSAGGRRNRASAGQNQRHRDGQLLGPGDAPVGHGLSRA